jgi:hypothetical protein
MQNAADVLPGSVSGVAVRRAPSTVNSPPGFPVSPASCDRTVQDKQLKGQHTEHAGAFAPQYVYKHSRAVMGMGRMSWALQALCYSHLHTSRHCRCPLFSTATCHCLNCSRPGWAHVT